MLTRRGLLRGLGAVIAAPAIVRASSLMALSPLRVYETPFVALDDAERGEFVRLGVRWEEIPKLLLPGVRAITADYQSVKNAYVKAFAHG